MSDLGVWEPLTPAEVASVLADLNGPWWIAGGLCIDAFLGCPTRDHGDIDISVLRDDQLAVRRALAGWELQAVDPPGKLRPWRDGEMLPEGVHNLWCRPSAEAAWGLELMLEEADGAEWVYRRSAAVHRPIETLTSIVDGVPYMAVEVQLLYKAGNMSPESTADFEACLPALSFAQRRWLASAIALAHPGHDWIERLDRANMDSGT